ncbi:hypothetical protein ACP70R_023683 [Stipagrostis hirtigluma subsp. patula]
MAHRRSSRRQAVGQTEWSDLPPELLERVVAVLGPRDRVAVRLVCVSWRACVREWFPSDFPFEAPRLLLRRPGPGGELAFFSLRCRKILPFALPARLGAGRCCGHVAGWLAMALDSDRALVLCNPVSGQSIDVPPPPVFPVSKVVLSAPPTSAGWVAAALGRTGMIALLQPSVSGAWMTMGVDEGAEHGSFTDMAVWRGRLCALCDDGAVFAFRADLRARAAAVSLLREPGFPLSRVGRLGARFCSIRRLYLVESDGELMVVRKLYSTWHDAVYVDVEIHLLVSPEQRKWEMVEETPGGRCSWDRWPRRWCRWRCTPRRGCARALSTSRGGRWRCCCRTPSWSTRWWTTRRSACPSPAATARMWSPSGSPHSSDGLTVVDLEPWSSAIVQEAEVLV